MNLFAWIAWCGKPGATKQHRFTGEHLPKVNLCAKLEKPWRWPPKENPPSPETTRAKAYRGTSHIRNTPLLGPCRRPIPRVIGGVLGGVAFSYARATAVGHQARSIHR